MLAIKDGFKSPQNKSEEVKPTVNGLFVAERIPLFHRKNVWVWHSLAPIL